MDHYGQGWWIFRAPVFPPTANNQYGKGRGGQKFLKPELLKFRQDIAFCSRHLEKGYFTKIAIIYLLCSPKWLNKDCTIRAMDTDNSVKTLGDAIQLALDMPDQLHWETHTFKIYSSREETIVLFRKLPNEVDFYEN